MNKNIVILGSTGSIGTQAIQVIQNLKNVNVVGLAANTNIKILEDQTRLLKPKVVCVTNYKKALEFKENTKDLNIKVLQGEDGLNTLSAFSESNFLINALVGNIGLLPTIIAINAKKDVALANKETLVSAGELVMKEASKNKVNIYPIDSEHSAIFQCLQGNFLNQVNKIILTASGGPFRDYDSLENVTLEQALKHPNWVMGRKITIDSATLMNKGLEVIEAKWIFDLPIEKIDVLVHPQSIIHSMVEFQDSSIIAQMGEPDMKVPIQYAITYPNRVKNNFKKLDFFGFESLTFKKPNYTLFPCLELAFFAIKEGGTMPAVLNAANEIAVEKFLNNKIKFIEIPSLIKTTMLAHNKKINYKLENIIDSDEWARNYALQL